MRLTVVPPSLRDEEEPMLASIRSVEQALASLEGRLRGGQGIFQSQKGAVYWRNGFRGGEKDSD